MPPSTPGITPTPSDQEGATPPAASPMADQSMPAAAGSAPMTPGVPTTADLPPAMSAAPMMAQAPVTTCRRLSLWAGGVVIVLALAAAGGWWWMTQRPTPDRVFNAALTKLLSTKTITQSMSDGNSSVTLAYNGTNVRDPRLSMAVLAADSGLNIKMSGYGSLKNDYIKYTSFGNASLDSALGDLTGKWIQIRTNGTLAADTSDVDSIVDPRYLMFGDLLIGNFSSPDRTKLLNYIQSNSIYKYDTKKVAGSTFDGKDVYVYSITENIPKLKELNKQLATIVGIPQSDIQDTLDQLGTSGTTKVYVDKQTDEIVHYSAVQDGDTATGSYTDYDTTSLPQEPKADMTWKQFSDRQGALESQLDGSASAFDTPADSSDSTQRI